MSTRDWVMAAVTAAGAVLLTMGVVGLVTGDDDIDVDVAQVETEPTSEPTATPEPEPTSTPEPEPTATAAPDPTATPEPEPTATAAPEAETVEEFIVAYDAALAAGDLDFLYDRLHPIAFAVAGEEQCRTWLDTQFVNASALVLRGAVEGPTDVVKATPDGDVTVTDRYTAEVTLTFQGEAFDIVGEYALVDAEMRWLSDCT